MLYFLAQIVDPNNLPHAEAKDFTKVLNIVLALAGAIAFLLLVLAGFRYTISQGDANQVAEAKRMIIYTLVGLFVIAFAGTIVNFVLEKS